MTTIELYPVWQCVRELDRLKIPLEVTWISLKGLRFTGRYALILCGRCDLSEPYFAHWPPALSVSMPDITRVELRPEALTDGRRWWDIWVGQCPDCLTVYWSCQETTLPPKPW